MTTPLARTRWLAMWLARAMCAAIIVFSLQTNAAPQLIVLPSNGRVSVSYEPGLESVARAIGVAADAALQRIYNDLEDLQTPKSIQIQIVRDAQDLAAIAPNGRSVPAWAVGIAYPDLGIAGIALRRGADVVDPITTMKHELAHLALGASIGDRAPHWLHEGFAYQHSAEWAWDRAETLAGMAWFGGVIALDDLDRSFPAQESPAHRAYAQSYDFVGYLSRRGRWEDAADDGDRWPFRRFLFQLGKGAPLDVAAIKAFGKPIHALFDEWRDELTKRYLTAPIGVLGLAVWVACALLLTLAWWRKRRYNKQRLAQWERDEQAQAVSVPEPRHVVGPYLTWPPAATDDPLADQREPPPTDPTRKN